MASSEPAGAREELAAWFAAQLPADWGAEAVVEVDAEEVLVTVVLSAAPAGSAHSFGDGDQARLAWFRAQTRDERMAIAAAAETRFGRKVSWAAAIGGCRVAFTTATVPVMTRLRMPERRVLDTLIDAGVARTRSEALAWCVRLVGEHEGEWIGELREALKAVEQVRARGPVARRPRP
ncbi:MAG TPA: hypothetical protein VFP61_08055 [Acidimicrobiales bacterium]|nr:hypothetical protein [Acidimicrobiales bacterium]